MILPLYIRPLAFATFLAFLPAILPAQEAPKKEISETVSGELGKLRELTQAKDNAGAIKLLDSLLATAVDPSYDLALLSQIKAQILLSGDKLDASVPLLEKSLSLGQRYAFFDEKSLLDSQYLLGQILYQQGVEAKDPAKQQALFDKAYVYVSAWLTRTTKPTVEAYHLASTILYTQSTIDASKPDIVKVNQAQKLAEKGLYLQLKPKDQLYVLILASLQQQGENVRAAEMLEVLVKQNPTNSQYWQQLAAAYFGLAGDAKIDSEVERYNLRALLTMERAQAKGFLNGPKENFTVIALCFTLQQYDRAIELLEAGLEKGTIESSRRNWELLASAYQQLRKPEKSIDTYTRAIKVWPQDGQLEYSLAQLYYAESKVSAAYECLAKGVGKASLEKPGQAHQFLAYLAFELQRYKDTLTWAEAAGKYPDAKKSDLDKLIRAAKEALQERAATTTT